MDNKPNLFAYATSELSQDAFISWLLSWADPAYRQADPLLHNTALNVIGEIFKKHHKSMPTKIESIDIKRQVENLDVLAIINNTFAILIEDKTFTEEHSNQLRRYLTKIDEKNRYEQLLPIYFKTGNQSDYTSVLDAGYQIFTRSDMLQVLRLGIESGINNAIFVDYYNFLYKLEEDYSSYKSTKIGEWNWFSWQGFYTELQNDINGNWNYVANQSGGFQGFWWNFHSLEDHRIHLQLEQKVKNGKQYGELCFKIAVREKENRRLLRNNWYKRISENGADYNLEAVKPNRFGNGLTMTVAILVGDYRRVDSNGLLQIKETVKLLKQVEAFINDLIQKTVADENLSKNR